jgi:hypothetical protein
VLSQPKTLDNSDLNAKATDMNTYPKSRIPQVPEFDLNFRIRVQQRLEFLFVSSEHSESSANCSEDLTSVVLIFGRWRLSSHKISTAHQNSSAHQHINCQHINTSTRELKVFRIFCLSINMLSGELLWDFGGFHCFCW